MFLAAPLSTVQALDSLENGFCLVRQVGWSYHCKKRGGEDEEEPGKKHGNFAGETWRAIMDELAYDEELDSEEFEALEEEMELSQRGFCFAMGQQVRHSRWLDGNLLS